MIGQSRILHIACFAAAVVLISLAYFFWAWSPQLALLKFIPVPIDEVSIDPPQCPDPVFAQNVVVSVKTGATVARERVPVQARTSLRCAPNVVTFSDLEQDIDGIHMYDALSTVSSAVKDGNPDFDIYREQQELWRAGGDLTPLRRKKHPTNNDELAAWSLDKYKNVHVVEQTWAHAPDKDWYIFVDADTYVLWSTVLEWLATLDPNKKTYIGSEVDLEGVRFAHGGSGYILSRASMYEYAVARNGTAALWETGVRDRCCGDLVVGMALREQDTKLQEAWPLISGETQWTMPFGRDYWCHPQFTLHHMEPGDMESMARWEDGRLDQQRPVTPKEMFESLVFPSIPTPRDNWDNLAWDAGEYGDTGGLQAPRSTFDECSQACADNKKCIQYLYDGQTCFIGFAARYGKARPAADGKVWRSGWNETRIADWIRRQGPCDKVSLPPQAG